MQLVETCRDLSSLTYDFSTRDALHGRLIIVLHLFRDGSSMLDRDIATVEQHEAVPVLLKCRKYLQDRGVGEHEDDVLPPSVGRPVLLN